MNKHKNLVKVIQFERRKQTWFYTGRHRSDWKGDFNRTFTKDVNKIPKSGFFRYCLDEVYPERGLDWRDNTGSTLKDILKLTFKDKYHSEKDVSKIKVLTFKEQPVKYTLHKA